jgi:hypothetical protein
LFILGFVLSCILSQINTSQLSSLLLAPSKMQLSWNTLFPLLLALYLGLVRIFRYQRERHLKMQYGNIDRASLSQMTVHDAWAIQLNLITLEFLWAFISALKMAVYAVSDKEAIYDPS